MIAANVVPLSWKYGSKTSPGSGNKRASMRIKRIPDVESQEFGELMNEKRGE